MSDDAMPLPGAIAPPMANGEVVFDAPWQGRCFGMARALCEAGHFVWADFQAALIRRVGAWDANHDLTADYHYFDHFLAALGDVLADRDLVDAAQVDTRVSQLAARPHGHDH